MLILEIYSRLTSQVGWIINAAQVSPNN